MRRFSYPRPISYLVQFPLPAPRAKYRVNTGRACKNDNGRELGDRGDYENNSASWVCPRVADVRT
ncbi:hypothetical protein EJ571_16935 [Mycobacteroides franklinii]|uniref:Uncharacterized protein n=1 Tax=Mycobacteroides franklinii TaxID=948102 RepID=A0A4R5P989_9MYCO|nr:hypothetical protein BST24_14180 [Mycobacteroides franklinii]TDH20457.1 hypothetical protein EJ571_16935 [Mycobacteroides franklinii]